MIRVLAFIEAHTVTGPAKNLIEFARRSQSIEDCEPVAVEIATFQRSAGTNPFVEAVNAAGIPFHPIPERGAFDRDVIASMRALTRSVQPDLLQTHALKSHFLLRASGLWTSHRWIAWHHGYTLTTKRMRLYNELDRWSLRKAFHVFTVSRPFASQLSGNGVKSERITILHNAISTSWGDAASNPELRAATRASLGIAEAERAILIVGRLSREKAHDELIRALARVHVRAPEVPFRLMIVGEGPERAAIEKTACLEGMQDRVRLLGQAVDVKPYYAAADLAVLASVTEGSPNALLEAMAARVPVVATAVGGIPEIMSHRDTGLLVPAGDRNALSDAILSALKNYEESRAMADRARSLIRTKFSPGERTRFLNRFYVKATREQTA